MMRSIAPLADQVRAERRPASADNPFTAMEQKFSETIVHGLNIFRDLRDEMVESTFHAIYGSPLVQAACGISYNDAPPRPRPGLLPSVLAAAEKERLRLKERIPEGNVFDAAARVVIYIGKAQHRIDEKTFVALRKLLLAHPEISETEFKAVLREQWAILKVDELAAIEALPRLLPADVAARRAFTDLLQKTVSATSKLNADGQRRLSKVLDLLAS